MIRMLLPALISLFSAAALADLQSIQADLQQKFAKTPIQSIQESKIPGLYEVMTGSNILYYHPEQEVLFFGELYTLDGQSITAEAMARLAKTKVQQLPLDQALIIGPETGIPIIEFTDPDCPYCHKLDQFLRKQSTPIRRIIFFDTRIHPDTSPQKVEHILCADNPAQAFEDMYDSKTTSFRTCDAGQRRRAVHEEVSNSFGVSGTPTLVLDGSPVTGFRPEVIQNYLNKTTGTQGEQP